MTTLLESVGDFLHDSILASPMGISRLIDLLDDRREIIRNEGLLLLIKLSGKNADIQKIVAFESAFERLFSIIVEEGSIDGGIIVQDCFLLMQNLLRHNASNQVDFRLRVESLSRDKLYQASPKNVTITQKSTKRGLQRITPERSISKLD